MKSPVVRFAPSPTGDLHIGGARIALYNRLFALQTGGTYRLRIEDTDKERSTYRHTESLLLGLKWLDLLGKEEPVFQSKRAERHREVAHRLCEEKHAYWCYTTAEELAQASPEERICLHRRWRDGTRKPPPGVRPLLRLKAPCTGKTSICDRVYGHVSVANETLDDIALLRSDESPTYMLAVVVDDVDLGVTHVIRGSDHLNNALRQTCIYRALDAQEPTWAHIPLIYDAAGHKLSKRSGNAVGVLEYRERGYFPEALNFYLASLGNASLEGRQPGGLLSMVGQLDFAKISRAPAKFDEKKLRFVNALYLRHQPSEALQTLCGIHGHADLVDLLKDRAETVEELREEIQCILHPSPSAPRDLLSSELEVLGRCVFAFEKISEKSWTLENIGDVLQKVRGDMPFKAVGIPLRLAILHKTKSPDITAILVALGKNTVLERLQEALEKRETL